MARTARARRSGCTSGSASADTEEARVALVLDELERTGAFERQWILVASPTGTGYVNYAAVSVARAAGARELRDGRDAVRGPAVGALARPGARKAGAQARLLLDALHDRLARDPRATPTEARPLRREPRRVVEPGPVRRSRHRTASTTPASTTRSGSARRTSASGRSRCSTTTAPTSTAPLVGVFNDIDEWRRARAPSARERIRYVMITHHNDGVALFGPELAIQAPTWLGPPETRPSGVPKGDAVDADHDVLPGARRHEELGERRAGQVRGHGPRLPGATCCRSSTPCSASMRPRTQRERIAAWLEENELQPHEWIKQHGAAGKSLAVGRARAGDARPAASRASTPTSGWCTSWPRPRSASSPPSGGAHVEPRRFGSTVKSITALSTVPPTHSGVPSPCSLVTTQPDWVPSRSRARPGRCRRRSASATPRGRRCSPRRLRPADRPPGLMRGSRSSQSGAAGLFDAQPSSSQSVAHRVDRRVDRPRLVRRDVDARARGQATEHAPRMQAMHPAEYPRGRATAQRAPRLRSGPS